MSYKPEILSVFNTSYDELNDVIYDGWSYPSFLNFSSNPDLVLKLPTEANCPFDFDKVFGGDGIEEITLETCPVQNPIDTQNCLPQPVKQSFQVWCNDNDFKFPDTWEGNCTQTNCTRKDTIYDEGCHTNTWCSDIDNCFTRNSPPKDVILPPSKTDNVKRTFETCVFSDWCNTWKKVTGYWVKTNFTKEDKFTNRNLMAIPTDNIRGLESVYYGNCTHMECHSDLCNVLQSIEFCDQGFSLENQWQC